jgi:hypothetical protein
MEKFKDGDMIKVTKDEVSGIGFIYSTYLEKPEEGILLASIAWSDGGSSDGILLGRFKTIEKLGFFTEEKGREIIKDLNEFALGLDKYSLGLPGGIDHTGEMIHIIKMGLVNETVD